MLDIIVLVIIPFAIALLAIFSILILLDFIVHNYKKPPFQIMAVAALISLVTVYTVLTQ